MIVNILRGIESAYAYPVGFDAAIAHHRPLPSTDHARATGVG
jgi:hypothetical protein